MTVAMSDTSVKFIAGWTVFPPLSICSSTAGHGREGMHYVQVSLPLAAVAVCSRG